jgi:hypothetical protein
MAAASPATEFDRDRSCRRGLLFEKLDIQEYSTHQRQSISLEKFRIVVALKVMKELKPETGREFTLNYSTQLHKKYKTFVSKTEKRILFVRHDHLDKFIIYPLLANPSTRCRNR